jgi:hypothetical protein
MIDRALAAGALAALMTSCAASSPSATANPESSATRSASEVGLPEPGQPFDATTLLAAMRDSRRPGGVPDEIETDAVAATLAGAIWTLDGERWTTLTAGGSCGPQTCTLDIAGANAAAPGEDLWVFEVTSETGAVRVLSADLRSLPTDLITRLDELARTLLPASNLDGLNLTSVRWLPPPDQTQFVLSYRSGDEERSSCGMDLTVDVAVPGIVSDLNLDC